MRNFISGYISKNKNLGLLRYTMNEKNKRHALFFIKERKL